MNQYNIATQLEVYHENALATITPTEPKIFGDLIYQQLLYKSGEVPWENA